MTRTSRPQRRSSEGWKESQKRPSLRSYQNARSAPLLMATKGCMRCDESEPSAAPRQEPRVQLGRPAAFMAHKHIACSASGLFDLGHLSPQLAPCSSLRVRPSVFVRHLTVARAMVGKVERSPVVVLILGRHFGRNLTMWTHLVSHVRPAHEQGRRSRHCRRRRLRGGERVKVVGVVLVSNQRIV